jgi:hypothetical protein
MKVNDTKYIVAMAIGWLAISIISIVIISILVR